MADLTLRLPPEAVQRIVRALEDTGAGDAGVSAEIIERIRTQCGRFLVSASDLRWVLHYTGSAGANAWTVYRSDADPFPDYGPGLFTGTHAECKEWVERRKPPT